jgi:hypothetical protein
MWGQQGQAATSIESGHAVGLAPHLVPSGGHIAERAEEVHKLWLRLVLRLLVPHGGAQRQCSTSGGVIFCPRQETTCLIRPMLLLLLEAVWQRRQAQARPRCSARQRLRRRQHAARQQVLSQQQAGGPVADQYAAAVQRRQRQQRGGIGSLLLRGQRGPHKHIHGHGRARHVKTLGWEVGCRQGDTRAEHTLLPLLLLLSSCCCCFRRLAWISCRCWAAGGHSRECGGCAAQAAAQHLQYRLGLSLQDCRGVAVRQHCQLLLGCRVTQQYQLHGCLE